MPISSRVERSNAAWSALLWGTTSSRTGRVLNSGLDLDPNPESCTLPLVHMQLYIANNLTHYLGKGIQRSSAYLAGVPEKKNTQKRKRHEMSNQSTGNVTEEKKLQNCRFRFLPSHYIYIVFLWYQDLLTVMMTNKSKFRWKLKVSCIRVEMYFGDNKCTWLTGIVFYNDIQTAAAITHINITYFI